MSKGRKRPRIGFGNRENGVLDTLVDLPKNRLIKAALAVIAETGKGVLNRSGVKATLNAAKSKLITGKGEKYPWIEEADEYANKIALILQNLGIKPNKLGVDGLPGSGKSTLARALAERLGMQWKSLDHENMNVQIDFSQKLTVYEHHRLFRTQNVDEFDAIIYIDESVESTKANIIRRTQSGRGAIIIDVLDFEKLKNIGRLAFDVCEGESTLIPDSNLIMKVRGPGGFHAKENLVKRLKVAGHDTTDLDKEKMLFLTAYARRQSGLKAYFMPGAFNNELLKGLLAGVRKFLDS